MGIETTLRVLAETVLAKEERSKATKEVYESVTTALAEKYPEQEAAIKKTIKELEKHGLTVVTTRMRHIHTMLGGLHCSTLDTVREGRLESYFD